MGASYYYVDEDVEEDEEKFAFCLYFKEYFYNNNVNKGENYVSNVTINMKDFAKMIHKFENLKKLYSSLRNPSIIILNTVVGA